MLFKSSEPKKVRRKKKEKVKRNFADYIVFISIFMVVAFTIAAFVLQFKGLMEISPTLVTCWFAFWTVEIVSLAAIRNGKVKYNYKKQQIEVEEENDDGPAG